MTLLRTAVAVLLAAAALVFTSTPEALAEHPCGALICPHVDYAPSALTAEDLAREGDGRWVASNALPAIQPYRYRLLNPCVVDDAENGGCRASDFRDCQPPPDRVVEYFLIQNQRIVLADGTTADGWMPLGGTPPGTPVGDWEYVDRACVDITALNPPPSPGEIYRYFRTLPLPQLTMQHQPPGNGLVGLPVIFYTDGPVTQTFHLTIRGFQVQIVAGATAFTWHTGDGADLTSTDPGAPYPDHTISYDYRSGTYTAYVTVTWAATFSVNGGASVAVPGTTTTDGPPVTFTVLQARPVLTNPYD
jgi:hypothetical protein